MPRNARCYGNSGFYHIIIRGINRFLLFDEPADYRHFLKCLERFAKDLSVSVYGYCLMDNHVHLLLSCPAEQLPVFMKKIQVSYAAYFNKKNDRCGHLFQDRYKSEAVEDERYLLTVLRYILNNPVKAGVAGISDYPWSSFSAFLNKNGFVNYGFFDVYWRDESEYWAFMTEEVAECAMEFEPRRGKDDTWALRVAGELFGELWRNEFPGMDVEKKRLIVQRLYEEGISLRKMARMTGISRESLSKLLQKG